MRLSDCQIVQFGEWMKERFIFQEEISSSDFKSGLMFYLMAQLLHLAAISVEVYQTWLLRTKDFYLIFYVWKKRWWWWRWIRRWISLVSQLFYSVWRYWEKHIKETVKCCLSLLTKEPLEGIVDRDEEFLTKNHLRIRFLSMIFLATCGNCGLSGTKFLRFKKLFAMIFLLEFH